MSTYSDEQILRGQNVAEKILYYYGDTFFLHTFSIFEIILNVFRPDLLLNTDTIMHARSSYNIL